MGGWTEHLTPEGLRYYYNTQTGTSSWEMPPELQMKQSRHAHHQSGHQHHQPVPPLPPLPNAGAGGGGQPNSGLENAMGALSMGPNGAGNGYAPPSSSPIGTGGGYLPHGANGLGNISGMPGLGLAIPPNGGHEGNGAVDPNGATAEGGQQWWPTQEQAVNVQ